MSSLRSRAVRNRYTRQNYLIVCCGVKTENNYFKALRDELPSGVVKVEINASGDGPRQLIERAVKLRDKQQKKSKKDDLAHPYDYVWLVFDKDDFTPNDFNSAMAKAMSADIECAYSNEAFELWYLQHFAYHDTGVYRHDMITKLTSLLGRKYEKNDESIYALLKDRQPDAIRNAKKLERTWSTGDTPAKRNPVTRVYVLVEELNVFMRPNNC